MDTLDRLRALLPGEAAEQIARRGASIREVRLRAGRPVQLVDGTGEWLSEAPLSAAALNRALAALMDYSLYAREDELRQGYFTMSDGCRVGVCGRLTPGGGLTAAGSVCVRIGREARGCAEEVLRVIAADGKPVRSTLILSPPGLGKTTLLRELARRLSDGGRNVCVADERHEIAACVQGVPTLNVGLRTDVMDGCPKGEAIFHMLRAAAPEVIVADEIGSEGDAEALAEAARCGVSVITSAHAGDFAALMARMTLRGAVETGVFAIGVLLSGAPGHIAELRAYDCGEGWHALDVGAVRGGGLRGVRAGDGHGGPAAGDGARTACGRASDAARSHAEDA